MTLWIIINNLTFNVIDINLTKDETMDIETLLHEKIANSESFIVETPLPEKYKMKVLDIGY